MTNDLGQLLKDGDPAAGEPGLSLDEVRRMRRTVVSAASVDVGAMERPTFLPRPIFVTLTVAATLIVAVLVGHRLPAPQGGADVRGSVQNRAAGSSSVERRQLQFATPGGTRIIWVFDSKFSL